MEASQNPSEEAPQVASEYTSETALKGRKRSIQIESVPGKPITKHQFSSAIESIEFQNKTHHGDTGKS